VKSHQYPQKPARLLSPPIARCSEEHRHPFISLKIWRKPYINCNLNAIAHLDIDRLIATITSRYLLLARQSDGDGESDYNQE
jgi:hypothetical protein